MAGINEFERLALVASSADKAQEAARHLADAMKWVPLEQADANLRGLRRDTVASMSWVNGGHDAAISVDDLMPQLEAWFGRYLRGVEPPANDPGRPVLCRPRGLPGP